MKKFIRKNLYGLCAGLMLTAFTSYGLLDTFVIPRGYASVDTTPADTTSADAASAASAESEPDAVSVKNDPVQEAEGKAAAVETVNAEAAAEIVNVGTAAETVNTEAAAEAAPEGTAAEPVLTESAYDDGSISIEITEYRVNDTTIYAADVVLSSAGSLKTALAKKTYGKNIKDTTSEIASENGALLAINGDFYGARTTGYVIRNGVLYRSSGSGNEDLVIYEDGSFEIINEDDISAEELLEKGAVQVFSFGPALVEDGAVSVTESDEVGKAKASNPRTAIGIISENHYVLVVSDGRTSESEGLSLYELAEFMQSLGAETAYNLDGGGSSTMVFNGTLVNNPTTGGSRIKERSISDIVYIDV